MADAANHELSVGAVDEHVLDWPPVDHRDVMAWIRSVVAVEQMSVPLVDKVRGACQMSMVYPAQPVLWFSFLGSALSIIITLVACRTAHSSSAAVRHGPSQHN